MKLVLAGDNLATLTEYQIQHEQKIGHPFNSINVNKLSPPEIREKLGSLPMFGDQQSWKITGLEKIRSPKMKGELIELLSESTDEIIVVVQSELTPSIKKKFTTHSWQIKEFKMPKVFFQFTESIKVRPLRDCHKLLLKSLEQKNEWELHSLIARQFRLLLAVATALIGYAMRDGINYFRSPSQVMTDPPRAGETFRIGGLVVELTVTDDSGAVSSATSYVEVLDPLAPDPDPDPDPGPGPGPGGFGLRLAAPAKVSFRPGKAAAVKVTVTASGNAASGVKVCASVPARLSSKVKSPGCRTIGSIARGQTVTASLKAKTTRKARGTYAVRVTA